MSDSEIFICKHCGKEHEASTQEVASYLCPNTVKSKKKVKVLDEVSRKYLTDLNGLRQPQDPNLINSKDGEQYVSTSQEETEEKFSTDRNSCGSHDQDDDRSTGTESGEKRL